MHNTQIQSRSAHKTRAHIKKICITINSLANGGAEKQSLILASALQARYETHLVVVSPNPQHPKHLRFVEQEQLNHRFLRGNALTRVRHFVRFLKQEEIDVIFAFLPSDTFLSAVAGRLAGVPHIFGGIRNAQMPVHKKLVLKYLHNHMLNYSISNCHSGRNAFVKEGYRRDKMLVVLNGLKLKTAPIYRQEKEHLIITSVGRFVEQKDYYTAIRSIAHLIHELRPEVAFTYRIIGYGKQEAEIRTWIRQFGMEGIIELHINPNNVGELLRQSDIYLCTSTFEGLSNAVMEALSSSLPVVATDAGDNYQLVKTGENGFLLPVKDHVQLAKRLHELLLNHDTRIAYGAQSYEIIRKRYSFERFQQDYFDIIENLH